MSLTLEQVAVAAVGAVAEEWGTDISAVRIVSLKEVPKSSLEKYIADNSISYKKYQLGD